MGRGLVVVLLLLSVAVAWDGDTHRALGAEVCEHIQCGCPEEMRNGSTAPDLVFHDTARHHYYDTTWDCPPGEWVCPNETDKVAMDFAEQWVAAAENSTGCERDYAIGVAGHYFFDSKVFWHKVQKEKSSQHSYWEQKVGEAYGEGLDYCKYGICVTWQEFEGWKEEFNGMLGPNGAQCMSDLNCNCVQGKCVKPEWWENIINIVLKIIAEWF
ncbi:zinc dependent phospholipase C family protein [archaeon]